MIIGGARTSSKTKPIGIKKRHGGRDKTSATAIENQTLKESLAIYREVKQSPTQNEQKFHENIPKYVRCAQGPKSDHSLNIFQQTNKKRENHIYKALSNHEFNVKRNNALDSSKKTLMNTEKWEKASRSRSSKSYLMKKNFNERMEDKKNPISSDNDFLYLENVMKDNNIEKSREMGDTLEKKITHDEKSSSTPLLAISASFVGLKIGKKKEKVIHRRISIKKLEKPRNKNDLEYDLPKAEAYNEDGKDESNEPMLKLQANRRKQNNRELSSSTMSSSAPSGDSASSSIFVSTARSSKNIANSLALACGELPKEVQGKSEDVEVYHIENKQQNYSTENPIPICNIVKNFEAEKRICQRKRIESNSEFSYKTFQSKDVIITLNIPNIISSVIPLHEICNIQESTILPSTRYSISECIKELIEHSIDLSPGAKKTLISCVENSFYSLYFIVKGRKYEFDSSNACVEYFRLCVRKREAPTIYVDFSTAYQANPAA